jgi:leucyl/phenylalanyl-tRNA---protein transferase
MSPNRSRDTNRLPLLPEIVVDAYSQGFFPMADARHGSIAWYSPDPRAIIPIEDFNVPRSLRQFLKKAPFHVTMDRVFRRVIESCADRPVGEETWINDEIIEVYSELHSRGIAHSVETWSGDRLIGGLYGIAIGGAFFGESMYSAEENASKTAIVRLVEHISIRGYALLDTQIMNEHVRQFGAVEISRNEYLSRLRYAIDLPVTFRDPE